MSFASQVLGALGATSKPKGLPPSILDKIKDGQFKTLTKDLDDKINRLKQDPKLSPSTRLEGLAEVQKALKALRTPDSRFGTQFDTFSAKVESLILNEAEKIVKAVSDNVVTTIADLKNDETRADTKKTLPEVIADLKDTRAYFREKAADGLISQPDFNDISSKLTFLENQLISTLVVLEPNVPVASSSAGVLSSLPSLFSGLTILLGKIVGVAGQDHPDICADPMGQAALTDFGRIQQYLGHPNRTIEESFADMSQKCNFAGPVIAYTGDTLIKYGNDIVQAGLQLRAVNQELALMFIGFGQEVVNAAANSLGSAVTFCTEIRNLLGRGALGLANDVVGKCLDGSLTPSNPTDPTGSGSSGSIGDTLKSYAPYIAGGVSGLALIIGVVRYWYTHRAQPNAQQPDQLEFQQPVQQGVRRGSHQSDQGDVELQNRVSLAQVDTQDHSVSVHSTTGDTTTVPQSTFEQAALGILQRTHGAELDAAKSKVGHPTSSTDQTAE